MQGFEKPLGYNGKGKEGRGQGTDFETLNKPLPPLKSQGFLLKLQGFSSNFISPISECPRSCAAINITYFTNNYVQLYVYH